MKEMNDSAGCKHSLLKIPFILFVVLLLSAAVSSVAFAEEVDVKDVVEIVSAEYTDFFIEGVDSTKTGKTNSDGTEEWYDNYYIYKPYLRMVLRFADGNVKTVTVDELGWDKVDVIDNQSFQNQWSAGTHTCQLIINGLEKEFEVTVKHITPDDVVEIASAEYEETFVERKDAEKKTGKNAKGEDSSYFFYDLKIWNFDFIELRFNDGSTKKYRRGNVDKISEIFDGERLVIETDQSADHPWTVGTHQCKVKIGALEKEFDVIVETNPVPELAGIISAEYTRTLAEGRDSEKKTRLNERGETETYYFYDMNRYQYHDDFQFSLRFVDGSTKECSYEKAYEMFGYGHIKIDNNQEDDHWQIGKNTCKVTICGIETEVEVTVTPNPSENLAEIVSVEYPRTIIENRSSYIKTELNSEGNEVSYQRYPVDESKIQMNLRFMDGSIKQCSFEEAQELFGRETVSFSSNQSADSPWGAGAHPCKLTIGTIEKEFDIVVAPYPVDHISVTQTRPIIKDVSTGRIGNYLSVIACNKDGTETVIDYVNAFDVTPSDISELQLGNNIVTVTFESFSVKVDIDVIENPYTAILISEEEPFSLLLTKKDNTQEILRIEDAYKWEDVWYINRPRDIQIDYNEEEGIFSIGNVKSNSIPHLAWMDVVNIINSDPKIYDSPIDYVHGNITKENIESLVKIAIYSRGQPKENEGRYSAKDVLEKFAIVFGEENVDLTLLDYYDPETNTIVRWWDKAGGDGPEKHVFTFENGQYVVRRYYINDDDIAYEKEPFEVITYDTDLHITGIYLHDIDTSVNLPGDVDGDGELTSGDARLTLRAAVGLEEIEKGTAMFKAADVDGNGVLEPADARLILRASVKLEDLSQFQSNPTDVEQYQFPIGAGENSYKTDGKIVEFCFTGGEGTGCEWETELQGNAIKLINETKKNQERPKGYVGGKYWQYLDFEGVKPGTVKIKFSYLQPWGDRETYKTYEATVSVADDLHISVTEFKVL